MLIDNLESAARVFGHCNTASSKDTIRSAFWNLDAE